MRTTRESKQRGSAIVISLLMVVGMLALTVSLIRTAMGSSKKLSGGLEDGRAFLLAEGGLNEAYEAIRQGGTGAFGSLAAPAYLGGGVLWVAADDLGANRTRLTATAMAGSGRKALEAVVEFSGGAAPIFQTTLNSRRELTLANTVVIDSFDSSLGTYASQAINMANTHTYARDGGDVRSNEGIILNSFATVFGDAIPGPGYSVQLNNGSLVTGSTNPASTAFNFVPIVFPSYPASGSISVPNAANSSIPPGEYDYSTLTINKDATLNIEGPASIVVDDFVGGKDASLVIDATNGPVEILVRGTYTHTAGFEASAVAGSPMALAFMIDGTQNVVFPSMTAIRGAYYAPNATILFSNGNECWGAFAADQITMSNDMLFHFDENLLNDFNGDTGQGNDGLQVLAWSEAEVQPVSLMADRRDPAQVLGVDRNQLLSPADAVAAALQAP